MMILQKKRNIIIGNGGDDDSNGSCKNVDGATWSSLSSKTMDWYDAKNYCENLTECGHSDWHLPNIEELRTLIKNCDGAEADGSCRLRESCRDWDCLFDDDDCYCDCRKNNGGYYSRLGDDDKVSLWSSSTVPDDETDDAWFVPFGGACDEYDDNFYKGNGNYNRVRCVRSGSYDDDDDYGDDDYGDDDYGDSSYETGSYSCAEIYECQMNNCSSSDQNCQEDCFYKGTSSAQDTASTMFECWNSYCGDDSASNTCLDDYCYDETHECPLYPNTDCPHIYNCLNNCSSGNEDCQQGCLDAASSTGYNRFWDLYNCTGEYCSELSDDAYENCVRSYCNNELYKCGFRD